MIPKFRAWIGTAMEYSVVVGKYGAFYVNPGSKGNGLDPKDSASLTPFNTKYDEKYVPIMQCVYLTDKNGKEAYEQDIYCTSHQGHGGRWCSEKPEVYHKVIPYLIESMNKEYAFPIGFGTMEIIGNTFENKELIGE